MHSSCYLHYRLLEYDTMARVLVHVYYRDGWDGGFRGAVLTMHSSTRVWMDRGGHGHFHARYREATTHSRNEAKNQISLRSQEIVIKQKHSSEDRLMRVREASTTSSHCHFCLCHILATPTMTSTVVDNAELEDIINEVKQQDRPWLQKKRLGTPWAGTLVRHPPLQLAAKIRS